MKTVHQGIDQTKPRHRRNGAWARRRVRFAIEFNEIDQALEVRPLSAPDHVREEDEILAELFQDRLCRMLRGEDDGY
jgi:hypothetical protein